MTVETHTTEFHRNRETGLYRGLCSCGWVKFGTLVECQTAAAAHDMAWEPVMPEAARPEAGR